jgi:hypothetical protein
MTAVTSTESGHWHLCTTWIATTQAHVALGALTVIQEMDGESFSRHPHPSTYLEKMERTCPPPFDSLGSSDSHATHSATAIQNMAKMGPKSNEEQSPKRFIVQGRGAPQHCENLSSHKCIICNKACLELFWALHSHPTRLTEVHDVLFAPCRHKPLCRVSGCCLNFFGLKL